ncbi:MAG TPA: NADP-dependent malic enzyme [Candidatus Baltobacteraceae bacterium]|nr:NADP-dependent malic enzyme [Candidatus Baltobacteraceae bacterium]
MSKYDQASLELHEKYGGKLEVKGVVPITDRETLSTVYTPGVAAPCLAIAKDPSLAWKLTIKGRSVAVVTDGTAVLGLGDIGPLAAMPVMEGKALLFKEFAGIDAYPIALATKDADEIVETVKRISPGFGGINLEDISAPRCFEIERRLTEELDIPVFHDDQHGTAIVVLAGLINACKAVGRTSASAKVVFSGAGAAGVAVAKLLHAYGVRDITLCDSKGVIGPARTDLDISKAGLLAWSNPRGLSGSLADALRGADVLVGLSKGGIVSRETVASMASGPIVFAMANPDPEIMPGEASAAGASVVATGRSDFPNQINNLLAFPGVFRGVFDARATRITEKMKLAAAEALAALVPAPTEDRIIPDALDKGATKAVAEAVSRAARE